MTWDELFFCSMMMEKNLDDRLEKNLEALKKKIPSLKAEDAGKFALMRNENLVKIFSKVEDAHEHASEKFKDKNYSVHMITDVPIDLGYYSVSFGKDANI